MIGTKSNILVNPSLIRANEKHNNNDSIRRMSAHEKAQMIVDNDEAFRKLQEHLRASKVVTSLGVNAVLNKCIDEQTANLCDSGSSSLSSAATANNTKRRTPRERFDALIANNKIPRRIGSFNPGYGYGSSSFAAGANRLTPRGIGGGTDANSNKLSMLQRLQAAMKLEDEVKVALSQSHTNIHAMHTEEYNKDPYRRKSHQDFRPPTLESLSSFEDIKKRRSTYGVRALTQAVNLFNRSETIDEGGF